MLEKDCKYRFYLVREKPAPNRTGEGFETYIRAKVPNIYRMQDKRRLPDYVRVPDNMNKKAFFIECKNRSCDMLPDEGELKKKQTRQYESFLKLPRVTYIVNTASGIYLGIKKSLSSRSRAAILGDIREQLC